ncbi:MAG: acyl-CoA dehydrogenase family protein, partial [Thermoleophilia bacterium]|nr:acyl-CoA dehydrogenase family protein [Thermoleophilia bacterium]
MTATATETSPVSGLTDEQQDFVEAIRDFAKRECGTAEQREQLTENYTELHNPDLVSKLAELGWLGASAPEEYGGSGAGMVDACLFLEEGFRGLLPMAGYP